MKKICSGSIFLNQTEFLASNSVQGVICYSETQKCRSSHRLYNVQGNTGFSWWNVGQTDKMYFIFVKTLSFQYYRAPQ